MSVHNRQMIEGRKTRRTFAVLNSPKPFSLDSKRSSVKSVHFNIKEKTTKKESPAGKRNVWSAQDYSSQTSLVVSEEGSQSKQVYEPPIAPSASNPTALQGNELLTTQPSKSCKQSDSEVYIKLAEFLTSIDIGTKPMMCGENLSDERPYTDDDLDEILGDSDGDINKDNIKCKKGVEEKITPKVLRNTFVHNSDPNVVNSITCLVDKPGEDDFVCPPLPPPPSEEDLAAYSMESSSMTESPPPPTSGISPTYKAASKFSVWTPGSGSATNGTHSSQIPERPSSTATPAGFRSVARPVSKKPSSGPGTSTVTTNFTIPGQGLPQPSDNIRVTPNHELPDGAVYETQTVEDGMLHTDTYYPTSGDNTVLERTKKTTVIKAEHHHGLGPTDEQGIPVALRSTVDNPKAWYKNMFKQIHKFDQEDDEQNSMNREVHDVQEERPVVSQAPTYKPKKLGRITDYTPSEPYVVENKPHENKIPPSSTSYRPSEQQFKKPEMKSAEEPVHGREYTVKDYPLADYVVTEPKHVVVMHPHKPKQEAKQHGKKQPAKAKFDFRAQSDKQLALKKDQIVIITREVNKDWYEGETTDGKHSGMFPVSYVQVLDQSEKKQLNRGKATAKFDFNGTSSKQLSFKKGDSIELIERVDQNWYKASIGQKSGIIPANYVQVIQEPEQRAKNTPKPQKSPPPASKPAETKAPDFSQYFHNASSSSSSSNNEPDDKEKMSKASFLAHAVVNSGAHLSKPQITRGEYDIPELDDAALGISQSVNGKPRNIAQGSTTSSLSSSLHSDLAQNLHIAKPSTNSVSSDRSHGGSQPQLSPPPSNLEANGDELSVAQEKHVALYQYIPQNEDELELLQGDFVQVVEKCDDGWYVGSCERTGAFGTFPGNYVAFVDG